MAYRLWGVQSQRGYLLPGKDIFISYSRADRPAAQLFAEALGKEGFSVWWDAALQSGQTFDEVIEAELKASRAVVVLWSPRSVASRWVRAEATLADRRNKLVPAIIEACDRPLIFEMTHTADLEHWTGDTSDAAWQRFVRDLRRLVDKDSQNEIISFGAAAAEMRKAAASAGAARQLVDQTDEPSEELSGGALLEDRQPEPSAAAQSANGCQAAELDETQYYTRAADLDLIAGQFHCLEIADGETLGARYVVSPLGLKIGRTPPADVVLTDARVSRSHCLIELADDRLRVSDLNSTNGTFVDGTRISGSDMLEVGSILKVGNIEFMHTVRSRASI